MMRHYPGEKTGIGFDLFLADAAPGAAVAVSLGCKYDILDQVDVFVNINHKIKMVCPHCNRVQFFLIEKFGVEFEIVCECNTFYLIRVLTDWTVVLYDSPRNWAGWTGKAP